MVSHYDLCICLRVYPWIIERQKVFCSDKFTLYQKSLQSCVSSLWALRVFFYVLLDNCPQEYYDYTQHTLEHIDHDIVQYHQKQWNQKTFKKQFEILSQQKHSNICLFLEDDYLHLPWSIEQFVHAMYSNKNIVFGTTYCSPDYQNMIIHNYRPEIFHYNNNLYWAFASTTMTFFCTKDALIKYKEELLSYSLWNHDFSMRFSMTKLWIYNISNFFKALFTNPFQFKLFLYIWYKCFKFIFNTPKTKLIVPLMSWSTHIDKYWLAYWVDWHKIWKSF